MLQYRAAVFIAGVLLLAAAIGLAAGHYDRPLMERFYFQPPGLLFLMKVFTLYGSWLVLAPATALGMLLAYRQFRGELALRLGLGAIGAALCVEVLKRALTRARPDFLQQVTSSGSSFPSGHSLDGVVIWGMLALLIGTLAARARNWSKALFVIPVLAGWSRVYLGVHWPSDVLGGWAIGLMILAVAAGAKPAGALTRPSGEPKAELQPTP